MGMPWYLLDFIVAVARHRVLARSEPTQQPSECMKRFDLCAAVAGMIW